MLVSDKERETNKRYMRDYRKKMVAFRRFMSLLILWINHCYEGDTVELVIVTLEGIEIMIPSLSQEYVKETLKRLGYKHAYFYPDRFKLTCIKGTKRTEASKEFLTARAKKRTADFDNFFKRFPKLDAIYQEMTLKLLEMSREP